TNSNSLSLLQFPSPSPVPSPTPLPSPSPLPSPLPVPSPSPFPSPLPSPTPLPAPLQSSLAIAPEVLTLLRNPEAPLTPTPVVVGTPMVPGIIPNSILELPPILSSSQTPIFGSNLPNTSPVTTSLENLSSAISLREGYANATPTLTREQVNQFSRDFQGGQPLILGRGNIPPVARIDTWSAIQQSLRDISINLEVNPAIVYIFFGQSDTDLGETHEQMRLAVERSSLAPRDDDQLEIVVIFKNGEPIRQTLGLTRREVVNLVEQFRQEITAYKTNPGAYLEPSQQVYQWLIAPIAPELQARQVNHLNFLLDRELRSLPLPALHDGQRFLIESYSLAMVPPLDQTLAQPEFTGLVMQSEGIFSLASLWDVGEETTLGLMNNFSNHLTTAPLRAEALRRTQLAMLRPQIPTASELSGLSDRDFRHPYFWSAFTLVENPW
ncbi:MAG: CHAT domain-containing protein, partial [Coleofasciculaceae cyanobacterium SM2_1_6]|nr:CHAT domain-containing protein [Coleofasciculaceae cyanobacterium SM2_1_6]